MDIIVRSVLQHIQQTQPESIVAGGSVRDEFLGLTPKDYDIFVPIKKKSEMNTLMTSILTEFGVNPGQKGEQYDEPGAIRRLTSVTAFELEGKKFDIIGVDLVIDETEQFAEKVIETFDFGINMAYDTGSYVNSENPKFVTDIEYQEMSLHRLETISHLPNSIARYNSFNDKYFERFSQKLLFRAPCLELIGGEKKGKKNPYKTNWINQGIIQPVEAFNWAQQDQAIFQANLAPQPIPIAQPNNIFNDNF